MTEATAVTAYFHTAHDAKSASEILDVFFQVHLPHQTEPFEGRPWKIRFLVHEGVA